MRSLNGFCELLFIEFIIMIVIIVAIFLLKILLESGFDKLKDKCMYIRYNYKALRTITRIQYKFNLLHLSITLKKLIVLYLALAIISTFIYFQINVFEYLNKLNLIGNYLHNINEWISNNSYILSTASVIVLFIIFVVIYSSHRNKYNRVISKFQNEKLFNVLEYHSKIIYPIVDIISKNNKNIERVFNSMYKDNGIKINNIARQIVEYNYPQIKLYLHNNKQIVKKQRRGKSFEKFDFVSKKVDDTVKDLCEIIVNFNKENNYYSLNAFYQINRRVKLCYPFYMNNYDLKKLIEETYDILISNKTFENYKNKKLKYFDDEIDEYDRKQIIEDYDTIKWSIESILQDSISTMIKLEEYCKGLSRILNLKRRNLRGVVGSALEKTK